MVGEAIRFQEFNNLPLLIASWDEIQEDYLKHVGEAVVEEIDEGFASGQDALGRPWEPLKDPDGQILIDSGEMRDSIQYQINKKDNTVGIGGDVEYLAYHEFGTKNMPARPILQPAATWMEDKLIDPMGEKAIGEKIDTFTRTSLPF